MYTPKRDDEHPHPFHMRSALPGLHCSFFGLYIQAPGVGGVGISTEV